MKVFARELLKNCSLPAALELLWPKPGSALSTPDDVNPTVDLDDEDVYEGDKVEAPRTKKRVRDKPPVTKRNTGSCWKVESKGAGKQMASIIPYNIFVTCEAFRQSDQI